MRKPTKSKLCRHFLAGRDLRGTVTTIDALLTQEAVLRQILAQHGHYLMIVKKNQLNLYRAIQMLFQTPPVPARLGELLVYDSAGKKERLFGIVG